MKTVAKFLVLLLAVVMMLSCFAACGKDNKTPNKKPTTQNNNNNNNTDLGYEMPEKVDLDDYIYRAFVRSNAKSSDPTSDGNPAFACEDFWVNPQEGEPEDALAFSVYYRNMDI